MKRSISHRHTPTRLGPKAQKALVLLLSGATLALTTRPDMFFKVVKSAAKAWRDIEQRTLRNAIRNLYRSKLVSYKENEDGIVTLTLTENGKKVALRYNLDTISIQKPARWDALWRVVLFDIPERLREGRKALAQKLRGLGFLPLQKSVFIFPYECKNEIDFIVEIFELRPYVRFMVVKEVDIDLDLKRRFGLLSR